MTLEHGAIIEAGAAGPHRPGPGSVRRGVDTQCPQTLGQPLGPLPLGIGAPLLLLGVGMRLHGVGVFPLGTLPLLFGTPRLLLRALPLVLRTLPLLLRMPPFHCRPSLLQRDGLRQGRDGYPLGGEEPQETLGHPQPQAEDDARQAAGVRGDGIVTGIRQVKTCKLLGVRRKPEILRGAEHAFVERLLGGPIGAGRLVGQQVR